MLDMGFPPYDAEAAMRMGDNSRTSEIQRAAKEINEAKAGYLNMALKGEICERLKVLHVAFVSGMSDAEFRVLWGYLMHGNRDGQNITLGQRRLALLIDKSERAVRRSTKELEEGGWFETEKHQRKDASRTAAIPPHTMNVILAEIVDRSFLSGQHIEVPRALLPQALDRTKTVDRPFLSGQEVPKMAAQDFLTGQKPSFRPAKSGHITIEDSNHTPPDTHTCARADRETINNQSETINPPDTHTCARADPPNWAMNATLSVMEREAQKRIWRRGDGGIAISDGYRAELVKDFPLVPVDPTLRIVKTESRPTDSALNLISSIERKFAYHQRDEMNRERRYTERAAAQPQSQRSRDGLRPRHDPNDVSALVREMQIKHGLKPNA